MPSHADVVKAATSLQPMLAKMDHATTLSALIFAALCFARSLAAMLVENELARQASLPTLWPRCPNCGARIQSKGFRPRKVLTLLGTIHWKRRVGRCPTKGCRHKQVVPLDQALSILPHQQASHELRLVACALAVFVPFEAASTLLGMLTGIPVSAGAIWQRVQEAGRKAMKDLEHRLEKALDEPAVDEEYLAPEVAALPLLMGADGVMAPFRPKLGTPKGKTVWREVKVAIFARLGKRITRTGEQTPRLMQRRLVAVLGSTELLSRRMMLEALRQGIRTAQRVVWLSDGGRGFWTVYTERFSRHALGILDFYHAAQNLWKAAVACLDGRTKDARNWFAGARHRLRHGNPEDVLDDIHQALTTKGLPESAQRVLRNLYDYLQTHREHIDYARFKELGIPIGSGLVESACKWLIQQRFKGVGMRWSEDGFNHLLHLRLAWVNSSFESMFLPPPNV
jgi:hypothetical protein